MELSSAKILAENLMVKYGLIELGWTFTFDSARRRFGLCSYRRKVIALSKTLTELNHESDVKNTILHEIAHALTPGNHHNHIWKRKAMEIGCTGDRCYNNNKVKTPEAKYVAICHNCGKTHKRHRKSNSISSCGSCSNGRYNPTYQLSFKPNPTYQCA